MKGDDDIFSAQDKELKQNNLKKFLNMSQYGGKLQGTPQQQ